ncbi:MAG: hypothetical protein KGS72_20800 [Cyanobacteria bacterium REEB67]|nr:hypothetical protein [Cyanobacteria bacterium REEB67]
MAGANQVSEVSAVLTRFIPRIDSESDRLSELVVQMMMAAARAPGFWSGETIPADAGLSGVPGEWKLIQRFATAALAESWCQSSSCQNLIGAFELICQSVGISVVDNLRHELACATTAIVTEVRPGMEDEYFAWEAKIQCAQAKFPGYGGIYLQPPTAGRKSQWATLLRFDSPANLEQWFNSSERQDLLKEAEKFVSHTHIHTVASSFPGWVDIDQATGRSPQNWKTAMLVLMGIFPVVNLEIRFLSPHLAALHPAVELFVNMVGSVLATTYVTMPILIKRFRWWLLPKEPNAALDLKGIAIVLAIYASEIALFVCL